MKLINIIFAVIWLVCLPAIIILDIALIGTTSVWFCVAYCFFATIFIIIGYNIHKQEVKKIEII